MGQTMAEKLFSRKNLAGSPVKAGEIIEAKLDGLMFHYGLFRATQQAIEAGFTEGLPRVWDQDRVFVLVDHHQPAPTQALADRNQVLRRQVERLGIKTFHDAEPGIAHQMMPDYGLVRPGELVPGTDSHAVAYGALNAGGTGISGIEAVYAAIFGELWFQVPKTVKVVLEGHQPSYPIAKDIILSLAGQYGDDFAGSLSIEYTGSLVPQLTMDSRMCLSTHGVEVGAKFALFPADERTHEYIRRKTDKPYEPLVADPDAEYERELVLNVDEMPFVVAKPHQFGNVAPVEEAAGTKVNQAQIGSCANGRFEDIEIAARMLRGRKVAKGVRFIVSPASQGVYLQCLEAGLVRTIVEAGGQFAGPGCSICQPMLGFISEGEVCITATTRNFKGRKGSLNADIYLAGPLTVTAAAVAGEIVNPKEVFHDL
ncbi:MAG: aconitase/3-isopropylmalate dehydratase large subunit family protein [Dehalococcoidia bacterium]|nr:aconitase/3-isopropylmalate dehydratase large subunit family protein [Dehalococcoidia bacterium]MDP6228585.1 aconitase/3-isopropylmalate dehydratase large subunit family protein [Dehalococcoidia bacterium]MDP7085520.1 aconitase/3-isopropylmalate dehydratase large subunit family protein [Dehalococcoidia bacterium]MDP7202032.1 aconitase/3-isopropylmalate dehydratase large subunit family protein [Dehalococcoidia bacterium]HJN88319.1 aconitase/3-isopropylmalate dehydratase large subunit family p